MGPDLPPYTVCIDGSSDDAEACAQLLTREGHTVIRDSPDAPPADVLVADCWTAETAAIVTRHRAAGTTVTNIGELLMTRTQAHTLGVTGSAGKTTVTRLAAAMMRASGIDVTLSTSARAANAWPSGDLIAALPGPPRAAWLALELTSTHLAYMACSPDVAVMTTFWPDHIELHGSLARYRAAKATILNHQGPGGVCVLNVDDPGAASFAELARGATLHASAKGPVTAGVGIEHDRIVAHMHGAHVTLCGVDVLPPGPLASMITTAACAALACGATTHAVATQMTTPLEIPHRRHLLGTVEGVTIIDDSAATTPRKARATLGGLDPARTIAIVGGALDVGGHPVHASPEEDTELQHTLALFAGCRAIVGFGAACARMPTALPTDGIQDALQTALGLARPGDAIVLSPMFPVSMPERETFVALVRRRADA